MQLITNGVALEGNQGQLQQGDSIYTITDDAKYGLVIRKTDYEGEDGITIKAVVSNEICLK